MRWKIHLKIWIGIALLIGSFFGIKLLGSYDVLRTVVIMIFFIFASMAYYAIYDILVSLEDQTDIGTD